MAFDMSQHMSIGALLRYTLPSIGMTVFMSLYVMVDGFFVSHFAGATALAFQAGRLVLLDGPRAIEYANAHSIAIVGVESGLPYAPLRPEQ